MTLQGNKTHHKKNDEVIRPHIPGWDDDQRRIHRVRRRIRQAPWWLWALMVVILMVIAFAGGWSWPSARSSVLAEQLEQARAEADGLRVDNMALSSDVVALEEREATLTGEVSRLDEALSGSVSAEAHAALEVQRQTAVDELDEVQAELIELRPQLAKAGEQIEQLTLVDIPALKRQVEAQAERANLLQTAEATRIAALPRQVIANLTANPPSATADYQIAVYHETWAEAFGQPVFGWLDEFKSVTAKGNATFVAAGSYDAVNSGGSTEVRISLPSLASYGIYGYTLQSFDYEPGFLARVNEQDVSELMVWVEHNYLVPKVCADTVAIRKVIIQAENQIQSVLGERSAKVIWVDSAGRKFDASQLTNATLLSEAC